MNKAVFLGPSLNRTQARAIAADVTYLPPIKRGDLGKLLAQPAPVTVIGIVDGCFLQAMSVSPKEILVALDRGVAVLGSSSMGALRAAELDTMGMTGVGRIYELYRDGVIEDDDEVAITFDPDTLAPLCLPMVNIRESVRTSLYAGAIDDAEAAEILRIGKSLYFPDRSWRNIERVAVGSLGMQRAGAVVSDLRGRPDTKALDAQALLRRVAESG